MVTISLSKIKLVRESNHRYDIDSKVIRNPEGAVIMINKVLDLKDEAQEVLIAVFLDAKRRIIGMMEVSRGDLSSSIVHPREIFKGAILHNASSIILAHCHPSGEVTPSDADIEATKRVKEAGKIIGIHLDDHIIIGDHCFTSLQRHGYCD